MLRNLHHANLLVASPLEAEEYLHSVCKSLGIAIKNNPDFIVFRTQTFGIDDARKLTQLVVRKAVTVTNEVDVGKKVFFIVASNITREAQNALLKTFEDPISGTYFFLVVREEEQIVATLRSRMSTIRITTKRVVESNEAENFLQLSIRDRLNFAKKFALEERNISTFLDDLMLVLREKEGLKSSLKSVYNIKRIIKDQTLSPKMIIEHLSLVL